MINLYTDGACSGNPGPGGWGIYIDGLDEPLKMKNRYQGGFNLNTTNQQMELVAASNALFLISEIARESENKQFAIYSDSAYLCNCINQKWYEKWETNGWLTSKKEPVLNKEIWEEILDFIRVLKERKCTVDFVKIKGHTGNYGNEQADALARKSRDRAMRMRLSQ